MSPAPILHNILHIDLKTQPNVNYRWSYPHFTS